MFSNSIKIIPFILLTLLAISCHKSLERVSVKLENKDTLKNIYFDENLAITSKPMVVPIDNSIILHLKNGEMLLMKEIVFTNNNTVIEGTGKKRDINRKLIETDVKVKLNVKDVAIIEWNKTKVPSYRGVMILATVVNTGVSIFCLISPKTCYGSCPTFYLSNGKEMQLMAEGFSSSIASTLEENDNDALYFFKPNQKNIELLVTNEAYETHYIRNINLIAIPKKNDERIIEDTDKNFINCTKFYTPIIATADKQNITEQIKYYDFKQRYSLSDSLNLNTKEEVFLKFPNIQNNFSKGLAIAYRQSLMTTYLFYQTLAYMGKDMGYWIAEMEKSNPLALSTLNKMKEKLGGIKAYIKYNDDWKYIGEINENGPLATNINIINFDKNLIPVSDTVEIKLEMTKGLWRLDMVNLADTKPIEDKITLEPQLAIKNSVRNDSELNSLLDGKEHIINQAGDSLSLTFTLPDKYLDYEYFVSSTGFYYEWQRDDWKKDENPQKLSQLILNVDQFLIDHAKAYKTEETRLEELFWRSKYEKH